jgi:hypothetical protein
MDQIVRPIRIPSHRIRAAPVSRTRMLARPMFMKSEATRPALAAAISSANTGLSRPRGNERDTRGEDEK